MLYFDDINRHLYNVRDIKIAPVRLNLGFQSQGILSNDNRAEPLGAIISVAELYQIVKEYDKNFFENPMAVGRAKQEYEVINRLSNKISLEEINMKKLLTGIAAVTEEIGEN